jgi:hypothetical protein
MRPRDVETGKLDFCDPEIKSIMFDKNYGSSGVDILIRPSKNREKFADELYRYNVGESDIEEIASESLRIEIPANEISKLINQEPIEAIELERPVELYTHCKSAPEKIPSKEMTKQESIFDSYFRSMAVKSQELQNEGESIKIGIIDSCRSPKNKDEVELGPTYDQYPKQGRDTREHGTKVFNTIYHYAPKAEFCFYRVIGEEGDERRSGDVVHAISIAAANDVDILNFSGGYDLKPEKDSVSAHEIRKVAQSGMVIVTACGNYIQNHVESITFPANLEDVIGVSGFEPVCSLKTPISQERDEIRYTFNNSKYYCKYTNIDNGKCVESDDCELKEDVWCGNVDSEPKLGKPDVFSPVIYPKINEGDLTPNYGTSFSAPIITGAMVRLLKALEGKRHPSSFEIRNKFKDTGDVIKEGEEGMKYIKPNFDKLKSALDTGSYGDPIEEAI